MILIANKTKIFVLLLMILCSIPYTLHAYLQFNETENIYLQNKEHITVLVSSNNYPYEYLDANNEIRGIQIDFLKAILDITDLKYTFTTDLDYENPDIVSSLVTSRHLKYETKPLFASDIFYLYNKDVNIDDVDTFVILYKEYLLEQTLKIHPNNKMIFVDDVLKAISLLHNINNKAVIFDQYFYQILVKNVDLSNVDIQKSDLQTIKLYMSIDSVPLMTIITKITVHLLESNTFYNIYHNFQLKDTAFLFFHQKTKNLIILLIIVIILSLTSIALFYYFRVYQFKFENLVESFKKTNITLMNEMDAMILQIESMKMNNYDLLENINSLAFILDINGNILFINHYCKLLLGYEPVNLMGRNIDEILSKKEKLKILSLANDKGKNSVLINAQSLAENDYMNPYEIEIVSKEGMKKNFVYATHLNKFNESTSQIYCILNDISDRKKLKNENEAYTQFLNDIVHQRTKALKESEEQIKFVINSVYDSIFMIKNDAFTLVNEAFYTMTGWNQDKINDKRTKFIDIVEPSERDTVWDSVKNNIEKQINHFVQNTKIIKLDGQLIDVEIHFSCNSSDEEHRIIGIIHDIAQKKQYEEQKLQSERINTIITIAVTANDFINSPLMAIQGYVEMIEESINNQKSVSTKPFHNIYKSIHIIKEKMHELVEFANNPHLQTIPTKKYSNTEYDMLSLKEVKKDE